MSWLSKKFKSIGSSISSAAKNIGSGIASAAKNIGSTVAGAAKNLGSNIAAVAKKAGSAIVDTAKKAGSTVVDAAKKAGSTVVDAAKKAGSTVVDAAKKAGSTVVDAAKKAGSTVAGAVKNIGSNVSAFVDKAKDKLSTAWTIVKTNVKNSFSKESLLAFAQGFAQGGLIGGIASAAITTSLKSMAELDPHNWDPETIAQDEAEAEFLRACEDWCKEFNGSDETAGLTAVFDGKDNITIKDDETGAVCMIIHMREVDSSGNPRIEQIAQPASTPPEVVSSSSFPVASVSLAEEQKTEGVKVGDKVVIAADSPVVSGAGSWKISYNLSTNRALIGA